MRVGWCVLLLTARLGACALEGTVTDATTGKPIPGARVFANPQGDDSAAAYLRRSDAQGHFCFERLAPGTYHLIAHQTGYLDQLYGALPGGFDGVDLAVKSDETLPAANLKLSPRTIVSGLVLHADGTPAAGAEVSVYRRIRMRHGPDVDTVANTAVDDRGVFRFADLTPGSYYLAAVPDANADLRFAVEFRNARGERIAEAEATTYYAAAAGVTGARPIVVQPGRDIVGLTITLRKTPLRRLAGRLTGPDLPPYLGFEFESGDNGVPAIAVRPDGSFDRSDLLPGRYTLEWRSPTGNAVVARQEVDLTHGDVVGLTVVPQARFNVSVVLKTEGGPAPAARAVDATLTSIPDGEQYTAQAGEFRHLLRGAYRLTAWVHGEAYYLKRVAIDGKTQARDRLELTSASSGPIELTFGTKVARITGRVEGRATGAVTVVLLDPGEDDEHQPGTIADQNGAFHLDKIRPGKFRLYAIEGFDDGLWGTPALAVALRSVEVELAEGDSREVTVPLTRAAEWKAAVEKFAK